MSRLLMLANDESTIYNFRREIVTAFVSAGHEVYISYPLGKNTADIESLGAKVVSANVSRHGTSITGDLKYLLYCIKLIRNIKPDVVLTYTVKPNIYGSLACQLTGTKYMNNITGLGTMLQNQNLISKLICFLEKIGLRKSSCVFFQNSDNRKQLIDKKVISPKLTHKILPGSGVNLSLHKFEQYPDSKEIIKFVIVSRVREDKGFNEFFGMAREIKKKYPNTEFHVVGWYEDDYYKSVIDELHNKNIIVYHGKKNPVEVHEILKNSHCLIHPSYHEGMANVILEASATGRPVLASSIPGCIEGINDGETGLTFKVKDSNSLTETVEKFINLSYEEKKNMGQLARIKMEKEFDRKFVAEIYLDKISSLKE